MGISVIIEVQKRRKDKVKKKKINSFIDWLIHMVAYALVLITVSILFKKTISIQFEILKFQQLFSF